MDVMAGRAALPHVARGRAQRKVLGVGYVAPFSLRPKNATDRPPHYRETRAAFGRFALFVVRSPLSLLGSLCLLSVPLLSYSSPILFPLISFNSLSFFFTPFTVVLIFLPPSISLPPLLSTFRAPPCILRFSPKSLGHTQLGFGALMLRGLCFGRF